MKINTMTKTALAALPMLALATSAPAALVTNWVEIFDGDDDNILGAAGTASPTLSEAHRTSIGANFTTITLANDGDSIELSGTVQFSGELVSGQFRIGLFDGDNPVTAGDGVGYKGWYVGAGAAATGPIAESNGTGGAHPFTGGTTIGTVNLDTDSTSNTPIAFSLKLTRSGVNVNLATSFDDGGDYTSAGSVTGLTDQTSGFSFNSAAFLSGGGMPEPITAAFSNIDVTYTAVPEPSSTALLGLGGLALILRRRK